MPQKPMKTFYCGICFNSLSRAVSYCTNPQRRHLLFSSLIMTPFRSRITRFLMAFTISRLCVTTSTVVPLALISSSSFMISAEFLGSRLPVGSSASRISGRVHQRPGQSYSLLFSSGKFLGPGPVFSCQILPGVSTSGTRFLITRLGFSIYSLGKRNILINISVLQKAEVLEYYANSPAVFRYFPSWQLVQRLIIDPDGSRCGGPVLSEAA